LESHLSYNFTDAFYISGDYFHHNGRLLGRSFITDKLALICFCNKEVMVFIIKQFSMSDVIIEISLTGC